MANDLKGRLSELVSEAGGRKAFAAKVWHRDRDPYEANKAKLSQWLSGKASVSPTQATEIATRFRVRPAWLLFGEPPKVAAITRERAELEADVAGHVKRDALLALPQLPKGWDAVEIDGAEVLRAAVEQVVAELLRHYEWERDRFEAGESRGAIRRALGQRGLEIVGPLLERVLKRTQPEFRFIKATEADESHMDDAAMAEVLGGLLDLRPIPKKKSHRTGDSRSVSRKRTPKRGKHGKA